MKSKPLSQRSKEGEMVNRKYIVAFLNYIFFCYFFFIFIFMIIFMMPLFRILRSDYIYGTKHCLHCCIIDCNLVVSLQCYTGCHSVIICFEDYPNKNKENLVFSIAFITILCSHKSFKIFF